MELSVVSYPDFVKLGDIIWRKGAMSVKNSMRDSGFVRVMSIPQNTGNTREFSEIDTNEYLTRKDENDQAARAKFQQGYSKTMRFSRIAENAAISYEMRTQNKYPEVVSALLSAGAKGPKSIDLDLSHRITFGTATSYTDRDGYTVDCACGDTLQLFYSAHTLKGSSTTWRNRLANNPKISKGALEGMERMIIENTYSQLGEKKTLTFDIIWTTDDPNSVNTAREYLQSTADVDGAHNGIVNVYQGKYTHKILPRVATDANGNVDTTKRYYWGLASSEQSPILLGMMEEPHVMFPQVGGNADDIQTDAWEYAVRAGYGICTPSALGITFSSGTGEA